MSQIIILNKPVKSQSTPSQKYFNRLRQNIEGLQRKLDSVQKELDTCLQFYSDRIGPAKQSLLVTLTEIVKILYEHYKELRSVPKNERRILKEIISTKIDQIFSLSGLHPGPEICAIFEKIEGKTYEEFISKNLNEMKENMSEKFKESGLDVDLSNINPSDDEYEILRKTAEAMGEAMDDLKETQAKKPKSKKTLEKELKAQAIEDLQKQGLSSIYKQLVKIFHPDLEQDPKKKIENEQVMKKLTSAYENKDLHTLLVIQMEWVNRTEGQEKSEDQLKIYNSLLKDQAEDLSMQIDMLPRQPRYYPIQGHSRDDIDNILHKLIMTNKEINRDLNYYKHFLGRLRGKDAKKAIHEIITEA